MGKNDELKKSIGERLKGLRKRQGLTQENAVEKLYTEYEIELDVRTISRYESGITTPPIDKLISFAKLYNTTVNYIAYGHSTSGDDSFTWYDNFKRLNRLLYTTPIVLSRSKENRDVVCLQLIERETKEWFGRIERFFDKKRFDEKQGIERKITIEDLDSLFHDFQDGIQLLPVEERKRINFAALNAIKPFATIRCKDENGELTITTEYTIQKTKE